MTMIAPRRPVPTCHYRGRETYVDTSRPVDEQLASHVVVAIVDDPEPWAQALEREGDAQLDNCPRSRRYLGEARRRECYHTAAQIRADGACRWWASHYYVAEKAARAAAELRRCHPYRGVRYEVHPVTAASACTRCHQPTIKADGEWRHHVGRYPVDCTDDAETSTEPEPQPVDGEWVIDISTGSMICGYCTTDVTWGQAVLRYARLTGTHMLGIELETGKLVVLAEAIGLDGEPFGLPHHCDKIPEDVLAEYADEQL